MEYPSIRIKRTKEELQKYNMFSNIYRSKFRTIVFFTTPFFGLAQVFIYFFVSPSFLLLLLALFLISYPFMMLRAIKKSSDVSYESNNLADYEIKLTFKEDHILTEQGSDSSELRYIDFYSVYNRKQEIIIYITKQSGLYLSKSAYDEETVANILAVLHEKVPGLFK